MTEMTVRAGGGFDGATYARMSDAVRARVEEADRQFDREAAAQERQRAQREAALDERRMRASIELAIARGEAVDVLKAYRDGGIGRTHAEILAEASARQDLEDRREAWRRAKQVGISDVEWSEMHSADVSAPHLTEEQVEREQARTERRQFSRRVWGVAKAVVAVERANGRF